MSKLDFLLVALLISFASFCSLYTTRSHAISIKRHLEDAQTAIEAKVECSRCQCREMSIPWNLANGVLKVRPRKEGDVSE